MLSYQYRKTHCGDKTVVRSSYLHNGISYTDKMASLYWFSPQVPGQEGTYLKPLDGFSQSSGQSSKGLPGSEVVQYLGHLHISPIWAFPYGKNLWSVAHFGSKFWAMHISETNGRIYSIQSSMVQTCNVMNLSQFSPSRLTYWPKTCQIWYQPCPDNAHCISPKLLNRFHASEILWNCLEL